MPWPKQLNKQWPWGRVGMGWRHSVAPGVAQPAMVARDPVLTPGQSGVLTRVGQEVPWLPRVLR